MKDWINKTIVEENENLNKVKIEKEKKEKKKMLKIVNKILIVKTVTKNKEITYMSLVVYCIYSLGLGP